MVKNLPAMRETWVQSLVGKIFCMSTWPYTPEFLPGESHQQKSLAGYNTSVCNKSEAIPLCSASPVSRNKYLHRSNQLFKYPFAYISNNSGGLLWRLSTTLFSLEGFTHLRGGQVLLPSSRQRNARSCQSQGNIQASDDSHHLSLLFTCGKGGPFEGRGVLFCQSVMTISIRQRDSSCNQFFQEIPWPLCKLAAPHLSDQICIRRGQP